MLYEDLLKFSPFALSQELKAPLFKAALREAFEHHYLASLPFRRLCEKKKFFSPVGDFDYSDLPYLPVEIFKHLRLTSVDDDKIVRTLHSSATSSQTPSSIFLDDVTRQRQTKTLTWLLASFLGTRRRPFLIFDADPSKKLSPEAAISARVAALRGFLIASSSATYCMEAKGEGDLELLVDVLKGLSSVPHGTSEHLVLFGYSYVLYHAAVKQLLDKGIRFSFSKATIIHIGGWKKLQTEAVSKQKFNQTLAEAFGTPTTQIIDIYGFTEQLGVIYPDCSHGLKHCSLASEVLVRDHQTLRPSPHGSEGLLEFITPLPHSYPGIAVLTDDIGRIVLQDGCPCGREGTAFEIRGRAKQAELRGCGDIVSASKRGDL